MDEFEVDQEGPSSLLARYGEQVRRRSGGETRCVACGSVRVDAGVATTKSMSEFIANMSHELRTPLNAIVGFSDILHQADDPDPEAVHQYSGYIKDAAAHLLDVVNSILDLSKIESGMLRLDAQALDLDHLVRSCLNVVSSRAEVQGVTLTTRMGGDLPPLFGDAVRIRQMLINLLSNAVKFSSAGDTVTLSVQAEQDGSAIAIIVDDSGIGMSADEIEIALKPFGQVETSASRMSEGIGLGLPITSALARLHNGRLELTSERGTGTTARILLPAGNRENDDLHHALDAT